MGFLSNIFGKGNKKENSEKNSKDDFGAIVPVEHIVTSKDQKERRAKSEEICKAHNVPIYKNPNALFLEPEQEVKIRSQDEVVDRSIALLYVALKSEGLEQKYLDEIEQKYQVYAKMSPAEIEYVNATHPTEQQKINGIWRYESLHVLLWALSYIDELSYPSQVCDVAKDVKLINELGPKQFRNQANLRSKQEILDQTDLILRLHWACVSARIKNLEAPGELDASVVYERHYALNWLTNYMDQDWDNISTDT